MREGAIVELARRIRADVSDYDAAVAELRGAVEIAVEVAREGARGTNLGEFVDDVLRRIAEKSDAGDFDAGAEIAERAFAEWRRQEDGRRAREAAAGVKILEAGIRQDRLRRNAAAAASKIEALARLELGEGQSLFDDLRRRQDGYYVAGRDRGGFIDLEISVDIARRCLNVATTSDERGKSLYLEAIAHSVLGERGNDSAIVAAIEACKCAEREWMRARSPLDWAKIQNILGATLFTLGERGDENSLKEAIAAFRRALLAQTRERDPHGWAMTQNNLGIALQALGERGEVKMLRAAINAHKRAKLEFTRECSPLDWAMTLNNLGNAQLTLGENGNRKALTEAVTSYQQALLEYTRNKVPLDYAMTQGNLGNALLALGERSDIEAAILAYHEALKVYVRDRAPLDWAMTNNNLGNAFLALFDYGDNDALGKAIVAYRSALEEYDPNYDTLDWAMAVTNMALAREIEADRMKDRAGALAAYEALLPDVEAAIEEFEKAKSTYNVEKAQKLLARLKRKSAGEEP